MSAAATQPPSRILVWVAGLVCAVSTIMVLAGAWQIGVTTDEVYHVHRLQHYFDCGWYLLSDDLYKCRPGEWVNDQYVYAPLATLLMHGVNVVVGNESLGTVSTELAAYQVRHLVVAVLGLVTVFFAALITRLITRSWRWAIVAAAILCALAPFTGNSMFNVKDVPVAAGYTFFTAGLVLAAHESRSWRIRAGTVTLVSMGLVLALGTRPGLWPALGASGLVYLVSVAVLNGAGGNERVIQRRVAEVLGSVFLAAVVLLIVYPAGFSDPVVWTVESASSSSSYNENAGHRMYVPVQFFLYTPTLLAAVGVLMVMRVWMRLPKLGRRREWPSVGELLVATQCFLMPIMAVLLGAYLYHGLRQLLFLYPALAILLTLEIRRLHQAVAGRFGGRGRRLMTVVASGAILVPTVAQLQLFPFAYAYASELADAAHLDTANDYWRASFQDLAPGLPRDQFILCTPALVSGTSVRFNQESGSAPTDGSSDCRFEEYALLPIYREWADDDDAFVAQRFVGVFPSYVAPGDNCEVGEQVWRQRHWTRQLMSQQATCELRLMPVPRQGIEFENSLTAYAYLLGGWAKHPYEDGIRMQGRAASFGMSVDRPRSGGARLELSLRGEVSVIRINNSPVTFRYWPGKELLRVDVPERVMGLLGDDNLVVTLTRHRHAEVSLRNVTLR